MEKHFPAGKHLDRCGDPQYFHLSIPVQKMSSVVGRQALKHSGLQDAYLRITISRGIGERGIDPAACTSPTVSIIVKDLPRYPAECYQRGAETKILSLRKTADETLSNQVKGCNYQNNILAKIELNQAGLIEGFMLNTRGFVAEGTVSNVFAVARERSGPRCPRVSGNSGMLSSRSLETIQHPVEEKELTLRPLYG
jgi:branched-chain amino acid aminotransferase